VTASARNTGRLERQVKASRTAVWALVRDFTGIAAWHPLVQASQAAGRQEPVRPGVIRQLTMADGSSVAEELVRLSEEDRSLTYRMLPPFPLPLSSAVVTVAVGPGSTPATSIVLITGQFEAPDAATSALFASVSESTVWKAAIDGLERGGGPI